MIKRETGSRDRQDQEGDRIKRETGSRGRQDQGRDMIIERDWIMKK